MKTITVRISDDNLSLLKLLSVKYQTSIENLVDEAIKEYFDEERERLNETD